ncbi:LytTR family DNA-binding domain-containing protein [Chryseolinea sp. T2]|uniref:LytR/AlgR family response regulator transcription factor n=1 Tax=Chryseolinea sp. T2 TaxID=3129255 RepID=UPI003078068E
MRCKCIIVDDEPPAVKILENYIRAVSQLEVVRTCKNAFEAMDVLSSQKVDLMFLDIHMPKLIGTDFVRTLSHRPKSIFTTAYKDFAIEAFDLDAIDYLLKPISFERFLKAVNKFSHITSANLEVAQENSTSGFVYFRSDRKMVKVFLDEIQYAESFKDYVVIHRDHEPELRIKQTLNHVENMLPRNLFFRIHRSFIVSAKKITAFTKKDVEIGKIELPIGKSYTAEFRKLVPDDLHLPGGVEER